MIVLPDFNKPFEYENDFYLSCDPSRISKILAHYEFYKMAQSIEGDIVECGILKGCSFTRFAAFRQLLGQEDLKKLIGFDTFGEFPETEFDPDKQLRLRHIEMCGEESISKEQLEEVLRKKGTTKNIDLIEGDIIKTLPEYLGKNPDLKVSLLNLDVDIYEPSKVILEELFPRITRGGILILDDYQSFPGETKAADDYFKDKGYKIQYLPFCKSPCYIVKE